MQFCYAFIAYWDIHIDDAFLYSSYFYLSIEDMYDEVLLTLVTNKVIKLRSLLFIYLLDDYG